jgi:AmpD protein
MDVIKKYTKKGGGTHTPNKLIIHSMSEYINGLHASDFLESIGLSAHFLIDHEGQVFKTRKTTLKAWHAKNFNTNSVGIELLVQGEHDYNSFLDKIKTDYCTDEQMKALVQLSNGIVEYYNIDQSNVLRHSDIDPERKLDPGAGFDWDYYKSKLFNYGMD